MGSATQETNRADVWCLNEESENPAARSSTAVPAWNLLDGQALEGAEEFAQLRGVFAALGK